MADVRNLLTSGLALLVVGKGGVGKTTVAAALARAAAREGSRVLLVELDGKPAIPRLFGSDTLLSYTPITVDLGDDVSGSVTLRRLTPNDALTEYLADHGFGPLARRLTSSGLLEMLATAIPGLGETLVMGKLKSLQASGTYDLVVIDAPATGHARTLLTSAAGTKPVPGAPLYSSVRAGATMLVKNVAAEVARHGVQVNALGTNFMDFPEFLRANRIRDEESRAKVEAMVPMKRLGTMEECAAMCAAFLDGTSRFQTGQFLSYAGGW